MSEQQVSAVSAIRIDHPVLVLACVALVGCGSGSSSKGDPEANARGASDWQQVTIAQLNHTGLLTPQATVKVDSRGDAHFVFFDGVDPETGEGYELKHLVWDLRTGTALSGELPETIVTIDNSEDIALAVHPYSDAVYTTYRGGGFRECNADIQSDAMFSVGSGGVWQEYTAAIGEVERNPVINDGLAGDDLSIVVDAAGNVHVAYQFFYEGCDAMNARYPDLKYVRLAAEDLAVPVPEQTVEGNDYGGSNDQNNVGAHNAMVLDGAENPAIFYYAELSNGTKGLRVARFENNQWVRQWIETGCEVGGISAAYSENDYLGVAYYLVECDDADGDDLYETHVLRYADNSSGNWAVQTVDEATKTGKYPSLAFAEDGLPAIAYYQLETYSGRELNNLYLARFYAYPSANQTESEEVQWITGWRTDPVAEIGSIGLHNTLWFDVGGKAHIGSYSQTAETIYLFNEL